MRITLKSTVTAFLLLGIFSCPSHAMNSKADFLAVLQENGVSSEQAEKLLARIRYVPKASKARSLIHWFREIGVKDVRKLLQTYPEIFLNMRLEKSLIPNARRLQSLGVKNVGKLVSAFPPVLGYNPILKIQWLERQGVRDITRVLSVFPAILGISEEKLDVKVEWLKEQGIRDIGKVLSAFPPILGYSISDNFYPKAQWLKKQGVKDLGKLLSVFPVVLSLNLTYNLEPKVRYFKEGWGISITDIETARPMLLGVSLSRIQKLKEGLDALGFDVRSMSLSQRMRLAYAISIEDVLANLRRNNLIAIDVQSVSQISEQEREHLSQLIQAGAFSRYLKKDAKPCQDIL